MSDHSEFIKRLRSYESPTLREAADKIERLRAENERMREALRKITDIKDHEMGGDWDEVIENAREIARAALEEK